MTTKNTEITASRKAVSEIKSKPQVETKVHKPVYQNINPNDIVISDTKQQKSRRKRMNKSSLEELTGSIREHGVIEPLVVKPRTGSSKKFDLIAGERRLRAAIAAKSATVPCMVRAEASDEAILDIQTHENLHREQLHPLDEANGYREQIDKFGISIEMLAAKIGKTPFYIHSRLKLEELIKKAKEYFQKGFLPLKHAELIAKYTTEQQELILKRYVFRGYNNDPEDGAVTYRELCRSIDREIHTQLSEAPFSTKAENLRPDGLACVNCPERTGYLPTLFGKEADADKCLNRRCFTEKTFAHITNQTEQIAQTNKLSSAEKVPLLGNHYYGKNDDFPKALNAHAFVEIKDKKKSCKNAETGVFVGGRQIAQKQLICRVATCEKHFYQSSVSAKNPADAQESRLKRKEELFDYRAGTQSHRRVLTQAMSKFRKVTVSDAKWLNDLVAYLWKLQTSNCRNTIGLIAEIAAEWKEFSEPENNYDFSGILKMAENLAPEHKYELLFLLQNAHKGAMFGEVYESQAAIAAIAAEFGINYRLIDAEERFKLTQEHKQYKKHADTFKTYLDEVIKEKNPKLPRVFTTEYKGEKLF